MEFFSNFLENSREIVQALITFMTVGLAVVLGLFFIFSGMKKVADYSHGYRQGQPTVGPVLINLLIGASLLQLSFSIRTIVRSVFGTEIESPNMAMDYMPASITNGSEMVRNLVQAGVWWIVAIGVAAILRGLILWNDLARGDRAQASAGWKGFWHILFGAASVNFSGVLRLLGSES